MAEASQRAFFVSPDTFLSGSDFPAKQAARKPFARCRHFDFSDVDKPFLCLSTEASSFQGILNHSFLS